MLHSGNRPDGALGLIWSTSFAHPTVYMIEAEIDIDKVAARDYNPVLEIISNTRYARPTMERSTELPRGRKQVRLTVFENEPLAHLAGQRLRQEEIPCVVRSLGAGPGGWGVAANLPHAIYVKSGDEMRARQVLDLEPAEIDERDGPNPAAAPRPSVVIVTMLIITAAALLLGALELVIGGLIR